MFSTPPLQVSRPQTSSFFQVTDGPCGGLGVCEPRGRGSCAISCLFNKTPGYWRKGVYGCVVLPRSSPTHVPWGPYGPSSAAQPCVFFVCPSAVWPPA